VIHQNLEKTEIRKKIQQWLGEMYLQVLLESKEGQYHLISNKNGFSFRKSGKQPPPPALEHNRSKNHMLPEGVYVKSLAALGIMDNQGKVFPTRRDKFNQINRFLEVVSEIFTPTDTEKQIVVDFGCGKAYLTFALMEILNQQKSKVEMVGIDRKKDVIDSNNQLVKNLGWSQMSFVTGNIDDPLPYKKVNIVLSLHACDTATDDAILQGLKYTADWILVAPCCQHELYHQIKTPSLHPLLKHGILKERISSILTDAIRADILEAFGYKVDVIEFVDTQHTPKNIMLRAKRCSDSFSKEKYEKCLTWTRELGVSPYIIENLEKIF